LLVGSTRPPVPLVVVARTAALKPAALD